MQTFKIWSSIVIMSLFSLNCGKDDTPDDPDSGKIKTGKEVLVKKEHIPEVGGVIQITGTGSPLDGMEIEVPAGSYKDGCDFTISYSEITSHEFGSFFNPASPLIKIENGGQQSNHMIRVKFPLVPKSGAYRNCFYYDKASGDLEGITLVRNAEDYCEFTLRHFSLIVITEVQKELLLQGGGFHTLFDPKINGWSFVNYGTYPEYEGICAGMSIGAAYYFKNFKSGKPLTSYFDNYQLSFKTADIWEDDAAGLRFATAIHRVQEAFWGANFDDISKIIEAGEEDRFFNLIYSMLITNQPQLIYLGDPSITYAHMIIGFGYEFNGNEAKINVYDPNYPNQESTIEYNLATHTFSKYTSAKNTRALENNDLFNYSQIAFIPLSTVMSKGEMDFLWQKVQNKTIEENLFPAYKIYAVPKDQAYSKVELDIKDHDRTNYIPFREFDFQVEGLDPNFGTKLQALSFLPSTGLERINPAQTIVMENRDTLIGLYLQATPPNKTADIWLGFEWFKIQLQDFWIEPSDTTVSVNVDVAFKARNNGSAPSNALYKWDLGDGQKREVKDSILVYKYKDPGEYEVILSVFDLSISKEIANVKTKINVSIWPKIGITLKGMDATPPSTIKTSDGADLAVIVWGNWSFPNTPALRWTNNNFTADFPYNISGYDYTAHISGSVSSDFKKINSLIATFTGIGLSGALNNQATISISNFPIEIFIPGQIIGNELRGPQAHATVGQLSWKLTTIDAQGQAKEIVLESVDWSSNQTSLSVYFFDR